MDNQNLIDKRIEAYFSGTFSQDEKAAFEQDLKTNPELQKAFTPFKLFDAATELSGERELRKMAQQILKERNDSTVPKLNIWEQIILFVSNPKSKKNKKFSRYSIKPVWIIAGLSIPIAICLIYTNLFLQSYSEVAASKKFSFEVEHVSTLGVDVKNAFSETQKLFDEGKQAELQRLGNSTDPALFTASNYFLGHIALKNKNFDIAFNAFDKTLTDANIKIINEQGISVGKIKFNRLLALMGNNKNKIEILNAIETLSNDPDCKFYLEKINALKQEINNPWRVLKFM